MRLIRVGQMKTISNLLNIQINVNLRSWYFILLIKLVKWKKNHSTSWNSESEFQEVPVNSIYFLTNILYQLIPFKNLQMENKLIPFVTDKEFADERTLIQEPKCLSDSTVNSFPQSSP